MNDIENVPHAFLFACLVDRQVSAETAWKVPLRISERIGTFEIAALAELTETQWIDVMKSPTPAHRMWSKMGVTLFKATRKVVEQYDSLASKVWSDTPSSARLVARVLDFHGAGPKISNMVANILVRDLKVELKDSRYIDISADVQVQRVLGRLGFTPSKPSADLAIYTARDLYPEYPGIFDLELWEIGRDLCRPANPKCESCRLSDLCRFATGD